MKSLLCGIYILFRLQYCTENVHPKYRSFVASYIYCGAAGLGILLLCLIGYSFITWQHQLIAIASCTAIAIPLAFMMPESYRWYFSKG